MEMQTAINLYKTLHFVGIFMVFLAYGGLIARAALGSDNRGIRRLGGLTSGIGLFLILLGGFGLLARLNYGWPGWVLVKIAIWVVLGGLIVLINRKPQLSQALWWTTIVLGVAAVLLVRVKPF